MIAMKRYILIISLFVLTTLSMTSVTPANAQASATKTIETMISNQLGSQAVVSICAVTVDGQKLVDINSSKMLLPASNMKLISTGTAIHKLGPEYRYETTLAYDGDITDGVLDGNVYIIGGGDPTLGSTDSIATPVNQLFAQWAGMLRVNGVREVKGRIIGDGRYFDSTIEHPGWLLEDVGTYYGAGTNGLTFYENIQKFVVTAGDSVGTAVNIAPSYPDATWMEFRYNCTTGEYGTGDNLYFITSELSPVAEFRGTYAVNGKRKILECSNKFPEYTCAYHFKKYLEENGITCGGVGDYRVDMTWKENGEKKWLGKSYSPTLDRIIFETNHISNNVYAEAMMRTLGVEMTGNSGYPSSLAATNEVLTELNVNTKRGCRIIDGSGLSRQNYISSDFICRFLRGMMDSPYFKTYLASLPYPGGNGTLKGNMQNEPKSTRVRIRAKSGSMNGVRCYSGYIMPKDGTQKDIIIFSAMINNSTAPSWKTRNLMDSIMLELSNLN
jgi:D-alanyl-D-alanine carboxypeptidase/D-alanyl-D-alanine-endopeptidase (penicillin-binding protein 4)